MAIAKNDMFDFLIDIVPREEIHSRTKTIKVRWMDGRQWIDRCVKEWMDGRSMDRQMC